jgi:hypothetical protein
MTGVGGDPTPASSSSSPSPLLSELPEPLPLPEEFKNLRKRLLDPKQWHLCTNDSLTSMPTTTVTTMTSSSSVSASSSSISIYDGPYQKKFRPFSETSSALVTAEEEPEEGEVVLEEIEINEAIAREREEENRRIRENLIAVRKARAMAEKKKVQNFRKYATRKRE